MLKQISSLLEEVYLRMIVLIYVLKLLKKIDIPVILFPGNAMQVNCQVDGILFLSLISGRNADMLIGKQVITAPILKQSGLEVISTGYAN